MPIQYAARSKQPGETIIYSMTYTPGKAIAVGDTLSGTPTVIVTRLSDGVVTTSNVTGPPAITGMLIGAATLSGNTVSAKIAGGTGGNSYKITFRCNTTNGEVAVEEDLVIQVEEL